MTAQRNTKAPTGALYSVVQPSDKTSRSKGFQPKGEVDPVVSEAEQGILATLSYTFINVTYDI